MIKIIGPRVVDRVNVALTDKAVSEPLIQAKGVMNNYLKDKHFRIKFTNSIFDDNAIDVHAISDSRKASALYTVKRNGDSPFLRSVYQALEAANKFFNQNR